MASYRKRGQKWQVLWKEPEVLVGPSGEPRRKWKQRSRTVPTKAIAKQLVAQIEAAAAVGEHWNDEREQPQATLRAITLGYVQAAVDAGAPLPTQRFRSSMLGTFLDFMGARLPDGPGADRLATELSLTLLEEYARSLPGEGRKATTRYRKVLEVERMWSWAHDRPERFPGVPLPRRHTGRLREADRLSPPPPVVAQAAPRWEDVDKMIAELIMPWHRMAALVMRYTGLRASQVCGLRWEDIDVNRDVIRVQAGRRGAKASRSRVVPLHQVLKAELLDWGGTDGLVFPRRSRAGKQSSKPYRGDTLVQPFRRAWMRAGVEARKWDCPADRSRGRGSPTHSVRRCVRTELLRAGVEEAVVLYLVGHSQGITGAAYVPESSPEQSPYWNRLVKAVSIIPSHDPSSSANDP